MLSFAILPLLIASRPTPVPVTENFPGANHNRYSQPKPPWDQSLLQGSLGFLAKLLASIK